MKRLDMIKVIKDASDAEETGGLLTNEQAEAILLAIENGGMLPPLNSNKVMSMVERQIDLYEWEDDG